MPERALWLGVLVQALRDAVKTNVFNTVKDRREARAFLSTHSLDFLIVCHFAGVDPDAMRARAKYCIEHGLVPPQSYVDHQQAHLGRELREVRHQTIEADDEWNT